MANPYVSAARAFASRLRSEARLDAAETAFFSRELETLWRQSFDKKYAVLRALELVPLDTETHPDAETFRYTSFDHYGAAVLIKDGTENIPSSDVAGQEFFGKVFEWGTKYGWTISELKAAALARRPLDAMKLNAARRTAAQLIDQKVAFGDSALNFYGFWNQPNVPLLVLPNNAADTSAHWDDKTGKEVVADLNRIANYSLRATLEIEKPDTIVMPPGALSYIRNTGYQEGSDTTIYQFFMENQEHITKIEPWYKANTAGASSAPRLCCYTRSPDVLRAVVPKPWDQQPPQQEGFRIENYVSMKCGGVRVMYPLAMVYVDSFIDPTLLDPEA
jgi:hypothetical protein